MAVDVESLYRTHGPLVLRRCRRLLRDEGKALDAMHDVFVEILKRRDTLDERAPAALLLRTATNVCLNRLRTQRRHPEDRGEALLLAIAATEGSAAEGRSLARRVLDRLFEATPKSANACARSSSACRCPSRRCRKERPMGDDRPVPDWLLERLARGELPAAEAARVRDRLEARGESARLQALELSDREILQAHPPAAVAAEVHRRARLDQAPRRAVTWRSAVFSGLALGAAGLAVLFALVRSPGQSPIDPGAVASGELEATTIKGLEPRLAIYRKQDKRVDRLVDGARVRPGQMLQLAYVAAERPYGLIASIDARGTVTLHLPEQPGPAVQLVSGKEIALPRAFELDATPGFERFVLVTSDAPFDTAAVVASLRRNGPSLPRPFSLTALTLYKDTP